MNRNNNSKKNNSKITSPMITALYLLVKFTFQITNTTIGMFGNTT